MLDQEKKTPGYQLIVTWGLVLLVMNGLGVGLRKMPISTLATTFIEEFVVLALICLLNRFWLHVPIRLHSDLSVGQQLKINSFPVIFIVIDVLLLVTHRPWTGHAVLLILLALMVAIFEESLFRGILVGGLIRRFAGYRRWGIWLAVLCGSLLFGGSHLINLAHQSLTMTIGQVLMALGFGLLASAMYLRTGSLVWPILFHFLDDAQALVRTGLLQHGVDLPGWVGFGPLVVYGGIAWFLLRRSKMAEIRQRFLK